MKEKLRNALVIALILVFCAAIWIGVLNYAPPVRWGF